MQLQFLGAAGVVTGSCYVLTSDSGESIMIDCGMFQGSPTLDALNIQRFSADIASLSGLVLTHAHLDHCGRLPRLLAQGFHGNIYMTAPTKDITEIVLHDSAKIHTTDEDKVALYGEEEVDSILGLCKTVSYNQDFFVGPFHICMKDAGHILGSASLEIEDNHATGHIKKVVFSGDLGKTPQDMIKPTEYIRSADVVVMESTYGDRTHPTDDPSDTIQDEITIIEKTGGTLLIPAFAIQRSQELLHRIMHLKKDGKIRKDTPIYFDSPMGERVTQVFERYVEWFNDEFMGDFSNGGPFTFPGLNILERRNERTNMQESYGGKVIIAGSGMMSGGRILNHATHFLSDRSTRLLLVGFQAENTLGRQILDGEKIVTIDKKTIKIRATITHTKSMSSHADQPRLLSWLSKITGVQKVFLTHGEDDGPRQELAKKINQLLPSAQVFTPLHNEKISV